MDSVDDVLDAARRDTGLDDFGVDSFREGLRTSSSNRCIPKQI